MFPNFPALFWFYRESYHSNKQPNKGVAENGTNTKQQNPIWNKIVRCFRFCFSYVASPVIYRQVKFVLFFVFLVKKKRTPPLLIIYLTANAGSCVWGSVKETACWQVVEQSANSTIF
jgi:hypothetical protein